MASLEPDEIDFEGEYDKADPIDDDSLDETINEMNRSIREQEDLERRVRRAEWTSRNKYERTKFFFHFTISAFFMLACSFSKIHYITIRYVKPTIYSS